MTRDEKLDICIDIVEHLAQWCKGYEHCRECPSFFRFNNLCLAEYAEQMDEEAER